MEFDGAAVCLCAEVEGRQRLARAWLSVLAARATDTDELMSIMLRLCGHAELRSGVWCPISAQRGRKGVVMEVMVGRK